MTTTTNIIYDSETDTLTCQSCKQFIEVDEPKILLGLQVLGPRNPADRQIYFAYHPDCLPEMTSVLTNLE